jgi:hypothetical protein
MLYQNFPTFSVHFPYFHRLRLKPIKKTIKLAGFGLHNFENQFSTKKMSVLLVFFLLQL